MGIKINTFQQLEWHFSQYGLYEAYTFDYYFDWTSHSSLRLTCNALFICFIIFLCFHYYVFAFLCGSTRGSSDLRYDCF